VDRIVKYLSLFAVEIRRRTATARLNASPDRTWGETKKKRKVLTTAKPRIVFVTAMEFAFPCFGKTA
jgi:hypothetical protein